MKKIIIILWFFTFAFFFSCASGDDMVDVYEQAIEDVQNCKTGAEISQLTYRVKKQLLKIAERPGGDRKMSAKETEEVLNAQKRYARAVEERAAQVPRY
jgi:hypothetical protein